MAAAMEAQPPPELDEEDCSRNDAIELLSRPVHIGSARVHHRKTVSGVISAKTHIRRRPRYGVRRTWVEGGIFGDESGCAAIDLGRRDVDVAVEKIELAQLVMEPHGRDDVRHEPVIRILPALTDHALSGEIDDVTRPLLAYQSGDGIEVAIEVEGMEAEGRLTVGPAIGEKRMMRLRRATDTDDVCAARQCVINEARPRKGIASEDCNLHGPARSIGPLRWSDCMIMWPTTSWRSSPICISSTAK